MNRLTRRAPVIALTGLCSLILIACGEPKTSDSNRPLQAAGTTWTTDSVRRAGAGDSVAVLSDVRIVAQSNRDQIIFAFQSTLPGIHAGYAQDTVRQCGSGKPVSVAGSRSFTVEFEPAAAHDRGTSTLSTRSYSPDLSVIRELSVICDFEAHLTWVVGTGGQVPFRVRRDSSRSRVVLEFRR